MPTNPAHSTNSLSQGLYVQYGAGYCAPSGWYHYDASLTLLCERLPLIGRFVHKNPVRFPPNVRYGNIVAGLPIPPNSCAGVYASHVLEHLTLTEMRRALINTLRMLRPLGLFRCVVPDLQVIAKQYLQSDATTAAHDFMRALGMAREQQPKHLLGYLTLLLGRSLHLWMWDERSLTFELAQAGFQNIRRCELGDAPDDMFALVEQPERFAKSVALECRRP